MHYVGDVSRDPNGVDPREFHGLGRVRNPDGVFKVFQIAMAHNLMILIVTKIVTAFYCIL